MKVCPYGCIDRICAEHPGDGEPCPMGYRPASTLYERDARRASPRVRWFIWAPIGVAAALLWLYFELRAWHIDAETLRELIR